MAPKPSASEELAYLRSGAAWQDSTLQSYRSLHLTFQSTLLAIGIGLTLAELSFDQPLITFITWIWILLLAAVLSTTAMRLLPVG